MRACKDHWIQKITIQMVHADLLKLLPLTHVSPCNGSPCSCSPNSRIHILEYLKATHADNPALTKLIQDYIETLKKAAVIFTHAPHLHDV